MKKHILFVFLFFLIGYCSWVLIRNHLGYDLDGLIEVLKTNNVQGAIVKKLYYGDKAEVVFVNKDGDEKILFTLLLDKDCVPLGGCRSGFEVETRKPEAVYVDVSPDRRIVCGLGKYGRQFEVFNLSTIIKTQNPNPFWDRYLSLKPQDFSGYPAFGTYCSGSGTTSPDAKWYVTKTTDSHGFILAHLDTQKEFNFNWGVGMFGAKEKREVGEPLISPTMSDLVWLSNTELLFKDDKTIYRWSLADQKPHKITNLEYNHFLDTIVLVDAISDSKIIVTKPRDGTYFMDLSKNNLETKILSNKIRFVKFVY